MFKEETLLISERVRGSFLVLLILVFVCQASAEAPQEHVRIGVLAKRGPEKCMEKWGPTAEYLSDNIPGHSFEIVPLGYNEVSPTVKRSEVDFVLVNSSLYVEAEALYGAGRIVTLKNLRLGSVHTTYGGVVFCKADRDDIKCLADLKGKKFMAVDENSFGGWLAAWREMKEEGIDPRRNFKQLLFGGTHAAVVYAVRDGKVDAGTVRTDTLERMAAEGKIRIEQFHVIHDHDHSNLEMELPFLHSTRPYPEWPLAKCKHTCPELAEKVAVALLKMPADCPAAKAARYAGWTIPLSYEPVRECLKELRIGPYRNFGKVTAGDVLRKYWYWAALAVAALALMAAATAYVIRLNRRLRQTQSELQKELRERKQAEEQIAIFRRFADASGQGFGMAALDHELTYVNPTFCRILGEDKPDDAIGKRFVSYYSEETQERLRDEILPIVLKGEQWVGELELISTNGMIIPTITNFFVIRGENDRLLYYAGVFSDITDRKEAEKSLRNSESKFRTLYEATSDAVMLLDEKGFFDCNDATMDMFGCTDRGQFLTKHPSELSPPVQPDGRDSRTAANEKIATAMKEGTNRFEWMHCRTDGTEFPAEVLLNRMELDNRTVLQAVVRDITDRKRAEEALRESRERYQAIFESTTDAVLIFDLDGNIVEANPAACATYGYSHEEMIGLNGRDIVHLEQYHLFEDFKQQVKTTGQFFAESVDVRKDGSTFDVEIHGATFIFNGKPHLLAVVCDISERKQVEKALRQAKEAAEVATRAKSGFLANMSHEIRTPMTAIMGYTDLMMNPRQNASERLNCLAVVRRNSEHLLGLINDILDISRIEAGKFTIEQRPCSIPAVVAEVTSMMRVRADERGISLTAQYTGPLPEQITSDQARLRQSLINLVGNAIKFTDTGGVHLAISFLPKWRGDTPAVEIKVTDTGIGISPENLDSLFEPFTQADASTSRKYGGTGLGLPITHRIAELMNGELKAESTLGKGSTFTITVPTGDLKGIRMLDRPAEMVVAPWPDGHEKGEGFSSNVLAGKRILVAEDGEDNMRLIRAILRKAGADVFVAENGRLAVDQAMREPFDVILMDMQMPEMDGYQATSYLRSAGYTGPIIALTAHAMAGDRDRCISVGCDDYLTKPIDRKHLVASIARHLDGKSTIDTDEPPPPAEPEVQEAEVIRSDFADQPDMAEVIDGFVARLPVCLKAMCEAAANGDHERLQRLAHQLKGAGGGYGYPCLTERARALEDAAKAKDIEAVNLALSELSVLSRTVVAGHGTGVLSENVDQ